MYKPLLFQISRGLIVLFIAVIIYYLMVHLISYVTPFVIAILISLISIPFVNLLEKIKIPRALGTIILILIVILFLFGFLFLIISEIIQGTTYLAEKIPSYYQLFISLVETWITEQLLPIYQKIISYFHTLHPTQQSSIEEYVQDVLNDVAVTGTSLLQDFFLNIPNYIAVVPESLTIIVFTILATFFITKDWHMIKGLLKRHYPAKLEQYSREFINHLKKGLTGYVKAQLLLILISSVIIMIGLMILKVKHALTITLLMAIFDLFPFVGTGLIFIPWIVYSFLTGNHWMTIGLSILYMVVVLVRQILEPKILSASIGINPLVGLFTIFISYQIWGVIGILFAPFLIILLNVLYNSGMLKIIWNFVKG